LLTDAVNVRDPPVFIGGQGRYGDDDFGKGLLLLPPPQLARKAAKSSIVILALRTAYYS
jgi:hypothetical protein